MYCIYGLLWLVGARCFHCGHDVLLLQLHSFRCRSISQTFTRQLSCTRVNVCTRASLVGGGAADGGFESLPKNCRRCCCCCCAAAPWWVNACRFRVPCTNSTATGNVPSVASLLCRPHRVSAFSADEFTPFGFCRFFFWQHRRRSLRCGQRLPLHVMMSGKQTIVSTGFASWQRYCTASSSGRQPNFAALNRGRHLCLAGRPPRWALAHILVSFTIFNIQINFILKCGFDVVRSIVRRLWLASPTVRWDINFTVSFVFRIVAVVER